MNWAQMISSLCITPLNSTISLLLIMIQLVLNKSCPNWSPYNNKLDKNKACKNLKRQIKRIEGWLVTNLTEIQLINSKRWKISTIFTKSIWVAKITTKFRLSFQTLIRVLSLQTWALAISKPTKTLHRAQWPKAAIISWIEGKTNSRMPKTIL